MESSSTIASHEGSQGAGLKSASSKVRAKSRKKDLDEQVKRRCVSTACIACRRRKSKCDGNTPACAACASVYNTECVYDPGSDHRRKGVYRKDIEGLRTRERTLQTIIQAILNYPESEVPALVHQIRTCESLDTVAEQILLHDQEKEDEDEEPVSAAVDVPQGTFEGNLSGKMGQMRLEDGSQRYIGGTSNLIYLGQGSDTEDDSLSSGRSDAYQQLEDPVTSWTTATDDPELVVHLMNMYFTWHYTFFTTLSRPLFWKDFLLGKPPSDSGRKYCTPLLVNAMLALGCHFTSIPAARANRDNSATAGDHFFKEAKRLIMENDEHEKPKITTVQALALMSVREAGCGREAKGWVYSGMSFRMACDLGLNLDSSGLASAKGTGPDDDEEDARRITFWGCFLFDKCWSNYMGRLPQLPSNIITVPKFEVFPVEDADTWSAYTDSGFNQANAQPSRTRAVSRQITALCEISNDLMNSFYNPTSMDKTKGKQAELKKLSDLHQKLEAWRRELPKELEPREGGLPSILVMHMFFQLLFIHLFRPFLKYNQATSPLPANVSPRKLCTQAAGSISKLLRLYKRSHGLRQICNIAVYIAHSACTIHLLNLPEKNARRDIIHGVKHLEEIAEGWLCARRTLSILSVLARKWNVELPEEAATVIARTDDKFGAYHRGSLSPRSAAGTTHHLHTHPNPLPQLMHSYGFTESAHRNTSSLSGLSAFPAATMAYARRASDTRSLTHPPQSAAEIQHARATRQAAAAVNTPTEAVATPNSMTNNAVATAGSSPSDLFGGVDALLRESQDNWWLRDQSQLALGFDNWGGLCGEDLAYMGGQAAQQQQQQQQRQAQAQAQQQGQQQRQPTTPVAATYAGDGFGGVGGATGGLDGVSGYGAMNLYNEDEWYQ
ncbi:uncharacterized protein K452DRAFT_325640 [Aplosporella prunicola CBS 121167]|uniref:Zn(2)-C6 fungal-type domain-containing protein n=1 Tax=Aplosporella prunicola CBS 121167 TaxID=1176127 RepID=A0A6A6BK36_9PEZI|nr:uncharacterized protein K452DRAFT_325640 [Aplosporella prunicola CBS 121167]KAF2143695.1 hypothetical protein K452DRAFT_325640 [Aplosporella prunicola CBS 121167]